MNFPTNDMRTGMLLLVFIPMVTTAVVAYLCFHRAGYGWVGKLLCGGFTVLVFSLFCGLMFNLVKDSNYQTAADLARMIGWTLVAAGFLQWFLELDRSLP